MRYQCHNAKRCCPRSLRARCNSRKPDRDALGCGYVSGWMGPSVAHPRAQPASSLARAHLGTDCRGVTRSGMPQAVFDSWILKAPRLPARTRLYPLAAIGVGTAAVESMTGYVMRLAEAHVVPVGALLNHELARFRSGEKCRTAQSYCFLPYHANGSNESAAEWVHALEVETGRTGLSLLTFLPLGRSFCTRYLFRRVRAWCPDCYEEWRASGRTVYEPLLWSVRLARVCSRHRRVLVETCPCCKNSMRPVGSTSRPGYCCNCRSWLGVASQHDGMAGEETLGRILSDSDFWLTEAIEQLIALMPRLEPASLRRTFSDNLRSCH